MRLTMEQHQWRQGVELGEVIRLSYGWAEMREPGYVLSQSDWECQLTMRT